MACYADTLKTKRLWTVSFCAFVFLCCVAYPFNVALYSYAWAKIETGKDNLKEGSPVGKHDRKEFNSDMNSVQLNGTNNTNVWKQNTEPLSQFVNHENITTRKIKNLHIQIGILIPSTTRNVKNPRLEKISLTTTCLPSIYKTMQKEYLYYIYVGIERGDYLETVEHQLAKMFDRVTVFVTSGKTYTKTVNDIARKAYRDGMDYLVRINDDTSLDTNNWTSEGINVLKNYKPPNIGVVGPTCLEGNTGILTHDMVHRTHLEIFDFYYPPNFDNWWTDDWITQVYTPTRSTKLKKWIVKHHLSIHGRRYGVDFKKHVHLNSTLTYGRESLAKYLSKLKY